MEFNRIFITGVVGSLILVTGAAWPEKRGKYHPMQSAKNWLFAIGGFFMFAYALMNYFEGGSIFFVILQILIIIANIFMILNVPDKIDLPAISIAGIALIIWSLYLFQNCTTVFFILGLTGIGIGYALQVGTVRRLVALTLGSALIALFSYIEASWIFFWLNLFFALFSGYYVVKMMSYKRKTK